MTKRSLTESAASGSVSSSSIAAVPTRMGTKDRQDGLIAFMKKFKSNLSNGVNLKYIDTDREFKITINEDVSLDQIYSKLSGIEQSSRKYDGSVTYGVEDDHGNIMKVSVRADQAQDFEVALSRQLADLEQFKMTGRGGHGREVSMAEILYNLKLNFDIVDVDFPKIPHEKVYQVAEVITGDSPAFNEAPEDSPEDADMGGDSMDMDSIRDKFGSNEDPDIESPMENDELDDVDSSEDGGDGGDDDSLGLGDLPIGEPLDSGEESEISLLKNIIDMLSSEAEARTAQYNAEAEKSKEAQAKYSMMAAQRDAEDQLELMQMEDEKRIQREREAEAKKMADLAKYRLQKSSGLKVTENLDLETEASIRLQRKNLRDIEDPQERNLQQQLLNIKRRLIQYRENQRMRKERENRQEAQREQTRTPDDVDNNNPFGDELGSSFDGGLENNNANR